ncbi:MAG: succinylglutamate desuccinylase/aspartoacylase family protein [Flavobacteriaceae bacterium]|nr:succinylglutamate desuccinylase/aspartoacylase family protein [Flavobacteriaceae bacterium]
MKTQLQTKIVNKNERIIIQFENEKTGPTVVFFGGVHGNEKAGLKAFQMLKKIISSQREFLKGNVYAIIGNLKGVAQNKRFIDEDLNRMFTKKSVFSIIQNKNQQLNSEQEEQKELLNFIHTILEKNKGPFYFIDFHTTSSKTLPFITINDAMINRRFAKCFPVPVVLGIEEYLEGPLLSYINQLGYVSLGFESGQHDEEESVINALAFSNLSLVYSGVIDQKHLSGFNEHYHVLKKHNGGIEKTFEVIYRYSIKENELFKMLPDFKSFQNIKKGAVLALSGGQNIKSPSSGKLFMPLYQTQGKDGFFIIKGIPKFFLKLSAILRKLKVENLLVCLPGIARDKNDREILTVNLTIARFFAKPIFHLLGYRSRTVNQNRLLLYNRERVAKTASYSHTHWYK